MLKVLYASIAVLVLALGATASAAERYRDQAVGTGYGAGFIHGRDVGESGRISDRGTPTCYRAQYLAQRNTSGACF
jgi:hypothetical protein